MNDALEKLIIQLLESRGNLSFDKSGIDNRRETMPIKRGNLKNRLNIKFIGKKNKEDEKLISNIAAQSSGVTLNKTPFAAIEDEDFGKKRIDSTDDHNELKRIYTTVEHENLHSIMHRYLKKHNIQYDRLGDIVKNIINTSNLSSNEKNSFERFKKALERYGEQAGAILNVVDGDEQLAYLLDYLNNKQFRERIRENLYEVLKKEGIFIYDLNNIENFFREFDTDLKRVWKKIRKTVKEI